MKDIRLLIIGSFNLGALETFYVAGFQKQGFSPDTFDITEDYYPVINRSVFNKILNKIHPEFFFSPINKKLLLFINNRQYDAIIVFKGLTLCASTIEALKKHSKIICCYNPDHPFTFYSEGSGNKHLRNSIKLYDIYFSYSKKIASALKEKFQISSFVIPFGFDSDTKPSEKANSNSLHKILFIGAYDKQRVNLLNQLPTNDLLIYGDSRWKTRTFNYPQIKKKSTGQSLFGQDYVDATASADAVLNFLRPQNLQEDSHNMRTFEVPGYAGLLIANRTTEQQEFFDENKEALFFDTTEELIDKIRFVQNSDTLKKKMKEAAYERASTSGYSYYHRSVAILNIIKIFL